MNQFYFYFLNYMKFLLFLELIINFKFNTFKMIYFYFINLIIIKIKNFIIVYLYLINKI
jgi:hypothetical protein